MTKVNISTEVSINRNDVSMPLNHCAGLSKYDPL